MHHIDMTMPGQVNKPTKTPMPNPGEASAQIRQMMHLHQLGMKNATIGSTEKTQVRIDSQAALSPSPNTTQMRRFELGQQHLDDDDAIRFSNTKLANLIARGSSAENTGGVAVGPSGEYTKSGHDNASSKAPTIPGKVHKMTANDSLQYTIPDPDLQGVESASTAHGQKLNQVLNRVVFAKLPDEQLGGMDPGSKLNSNVNLGKVSSS